MENGNVYIKCKHYNEIFNRLNIVNIVNLIQVSNKT